MARLNNYTPGQEHRLGKAPTSNKQGLPAYPSPAPRWINEGVLSREKWR